MPLFGARIDYALRALIDLSMQTTQKPCQSRDIAARHGLQGPYLDQILVVMKREGLVRSVRGPGGGYVIARAPRTVTVLDVVRAVGGPGLLMDDPGDLPDPSAEPAAYTVHRLFRRIEAHVAAWLEGVSVADLVAERERLDETLSIMPGI
jgi:Rrf2 family protein